MADQLPPPGIYGPTGVDPNPQTPFLPQPEPHDALKAAIRKLLGQ